MRRVQGPTAPVRLCLVEDAELLRAGVVGLLVTGSPGEIVLDAATVGAVGRAARHAAGAPPAPVRRDDAADRVASLGEQQQRVMELVVEGLGNREVARRLHLSEKTVKNHLTGIYARLGVPNRAAAAVLYSAARSRTRP